MPKLIYLDNHTITRPSAKALEKMMPFFKEHWGAIESPHRMGQELIPAVDAAAAAIYEALGADRSASFTFTSSGAEAISQVLFSTCLDTMRDSGRNHFLTTAVEEVPFLMAIKRLQKLDCHGKMLPLDTAGRLRTEVLEEAIKPRVAMLSLSMANSLTGVIQPISDLVRVCREKEILLHVDVSSVLGKIFFAFQDFGIDFLTFDGSLMHAPKGTGGVLVRKGLSLAPFIQGSPSFNVPLFIALATAMEEMQTKLDFLCTEIARLRQKFEEEIVRALPDAVILFQETDRLPNTSVIAFPGASSEALLFSLQRKGIYASFGGKNSQHLSYILKTCGIAPELALSALSFALSWETTEEEIERAVEMIADSVRQIKRISGSICHAKESLRCDTV